MTDSAISVDRLLELAEFAGRLADSGADMLRHYYRMPVSVERKEDGSLVSRADREVEAVLRKMLRDEYPSHGILGEEFPPVRADGAEIIWVLDPIDGTEAFLDGVPIFGLMIGLAWQERFVLGLIDQPILRERWVGIDGYGTEYNGKKVTTRKLLHSDEVVLYASGRIPEQNFLAAREGTLGTRRLRMCCGAECYMYGLLASGSIDIVLDGDLEVYDFAATEPIIRNAGGVMTDWNGNRLGLGSSGTIIAVGDATVLDDAMRQILRS